MATPTDLPTLPFPTQKDWENWLHKHYSSPGIWLRIYKKYSGVATVTYIEAVESALCYGWIDGQVQRYDDQSYIQRFTPRQPRSNWSKINTRRVEQLIKENRMQPSGMLAIEAAKADGRWQRAYDSPAEMTIPTDFIKELEQNTKAYAFFKTLNKSNLFVIAYKLQTAKKEETRERRKKAMIAMLAKGEKFY